MKANAKFQKGQAVFTCRCCQRRTKGPQGVSGPDLCTECFELSGIENSVNDGCMTEEEGYEEAQIWLRECVLNKGNSARLREWFPQFWRS